MGVYIIQRRLANGKMDRFLARADQLDDMIAWRVFHVFPVDPPNLIARQQFVNTRATFCHEPTK